MANSSEKSKTTCPNNAWVQTSWRNQDYVFVLDGYVWYVDIPKTNDGQIRYSAMPWEEWEQIPEDQRAYIHRKVEEVKFAPKHIYKRRKR